MLRNVYDEPEDRLVIRTDDIWQTARESGVDGYDPAVLRIVAEARNVGAPSGCNCRATVGSSKRVTIALQLYGRADYERERFAAVGFRAQGCLALIAAASVAAELACNASWQQALAVQADDIYAVLKEVPADKRHVLWFAIEAIRALVGDCLARARQESDRIRRSVGCDEGSMGCLLCEHCSLRALLRGRG
jgi:NifU-like protein involved in Fe-S cluster formation